MLCFLLKNHREQRFLKHAEILLFYKSNGLGLRPSRWKADVSFYSTTFLNWQDFLICNWSTAVTKLFCGLIRNRKDLLFSRNKLKSTLTVLNQAGTKAKSHTNTMPFYHKTDQSIINFLPACISVEEKFCYLEYASYHKMLTAMLTNHSRAVIRVLQTTYTLKKTNFLWSS